jgi:HSP20 family protein
MVTRSLLNRDPFAEMERMVNEVDRAFDGFWRPNAITGTVPVDIYEKDNSLFICAAVPGVNPGDLDISLEQNVLTIKGEIKQNWETTENTKVYRREQRYGNFTRSIRLPEGLNFDQIDAEFNNGFVTIRIPKMEQPKPEVKRISVRNAGETQQQVLEQRASNGAKSEKVKA